MQQLGNRNPFEPVRMAPIGTKSGVCLNVTTRRAPMNAFNGCLWRERMYWQLIRNGGGLEKLCCPQKYPVEPWIKMPATARRFSKINSITLPAMDGLDHLVLEFQVPTGYDGVIQQLVNFYTGIGFLEGSGQLSWRVKINNRYIKDYGNIQTTLGSLSTPYTVFNGPIRLCSRQTIQYFVNNDVASGLAGGRAVCALFGWFYPR